VRGKRSGVRRKVSRPADLSISLETRLSRYPSEARARYYRVTTAACPGDIRTAHALTHTYTRAASGATRRIPHAKRVRY